MTVLEQALRPVTRPSVVEVFPLGVQFVHVTPPSLGPDRSTVRVADCWWVSVCTCLPDDYMLPDAAWALAVAQV